MFDQEQREVTFADFGELSRLCALGGEQIGHVSLEERVVAGEARGGAHRISLRAALAQQSPTRGRVFGPHRGG